MMNVYLQEEDTQTPAAPAEGGEGSTDMGGDVATPATEAPAEGGEATPTEGQTM